MASFGRRPPKNASKAKVSSSSTGSSAFKRLKEEEEEREKFAREFQERKDKEKRAKQERDRSSERRERHAEKLVKARKGLPNPQVFLEVEIRSPEFPGRPGRVEGKGILEIELFADVVPKTAENFRCLCTGEMGRDLTFRNATFHRIIPGFMAQGGDITNGDGTGGMSIYGATFKDENFERLHSKSNLLSMANSGQNTNNSQFFILFKQAPHLDRKHVVFGEIVREEGGVVKKMLDVGSESGEVKGNVVITNCGEIGTKRQTSRSREPRSRSRSGRRQMNSFRANSDDERSTQQPRHRRVAQSFDDNPRGKVVSNKGMTDADLAKRFGTGSTSTAGLMSEKEARRMLERQKKEEMSSESDSDS